MKLAVPQVGLGAGHDRVATKASTLLPSEVTDPNPLGSQLGVEEMIDAVLVPDSDSYVDQVLR